MTLKSIPLSTLCPPEGNPRRTVDAAKIASLAESIRRLTSDREMCRAYANLAYTRARERFTTKRMIDQYLQLYRSLSPAKRLAA